MSASPISNVRTAGGGRGEKVAEEGGQTNKQTNILNPIKNISSSILKPHENSCFNIHVLLS